MTATNLLCDPSGVVLWSDTAFYDMLGGRIVWFGSKQLVNEAKRFACVISGSVEINEPLRRELADVDLDEAQDRVPVLMRAAYEALSRDEQRVGGPHAGLCYGGYSRRLGRFAAYVVRTAANSLYPGSKAFEPVEVGFFTSPEMVHNGEIQTLDGDALKDALGRLGVNEFCRRVMQNQRAGGRHAAETGLAERPLIGGECEVTFIAEQGVRR